MAPKKDYLISLAQDAIGLNHSMAIADQDMVNAVASSVVISYVAGTAVEEAFPAAQKQKEKVNVKYPTERSRPSHVQFVPVLDKLTVVVPQTTGH